MRKLTSFLFRRYMSVRLTALIILVSSIFSALPINAQYFGGIDDGTQSAFSSNQQLSILFPMFFGGNDDGFAGAIAFSQSLALPIFMPMFVGGSDDGFTTASASSQSLALIMPMYLGGDSDGISFSFAADQSLKLIGIIDPIEPDTIIIRTFANEQLQIYSYPNPVSDEFRINIGDLNRANKPVTAVLTNLQGRILAKKEVDSITDFDVRDLTPGTYFIILSTGSLRIGTIKLQVIH